MNPIVIWSKFKGYEDWCYNYRIPKEEEFIKGFKYEYISFLGTYPKSEISKPYLNIDYDIIPHVWENRVVTDRLMNYEVVWSIIPVRYGVQGKLPINCLKAYLEAGYIRKKMEEKLFLFRADQNWKLERDNLGEVKEYIRVDNPKSIHIIQKDKSLSKSLFNITKYLKMFIPNSKNEHSILQINNEDGYQIETKGEEITVKNGKLVQSQEFLYKLSNLELTIMPSAMEDWDKIVKLKDIKSKYKLNLNLIMPNLKCISDLFEDRLITVKKKRWVRVYKKVIKRHKVVWKWCSVRVIKEIEKMARVLRKITPKHLTIITVKELTEKYPSRFLGINKGYKPLHTIEELSHHLYNHQPDKNENRLVYIATKDRQQVRRLPWKEANQLMITQLADEPEWEYISKKEGRKFQEPVPGPSFIVADRKNGIEPYKEQKKFPKLISSTKHRMDNSKRRFINPQSKMIPWKAIVSKHNPNSIGEIKEKITTIIARNEEAAKAKAIKLIPKEERPYYKAIVERSIKSDTIPHLKGDNSTTGRFKPITLNIITTMKDGSKKLEQITTYKREYDKLPFYSSKKIKSKNWWKKDPNKKVRWNKEDKIVITKRHRTKEQIEQQRLKRERRKKEKEKRK